MTEKVWQKVEKQKYEAKFKRGTFTLWKSGKEWKAKYRTKRGGLTVFFTPCRFFRVAKKNAELSEYWGV